MGNGLQNFSIKAHCDLMQSVCWGIFVHLFPVRVKCRGGQQGGLKTYPPGFLKKMGKPEMIDIASDYLFLQRMGIY